MEETDPAGPKQQAIRTFKKNKTAVLGLFMVICISFIAILAPIISPYIPIEQNITARLQGPSFFHLLGTDFYGRDICSRIIWGARTSLMVGVGSVFLGLLVGGAMGILAAYIGGTIENILMRITDILLSFPTLVLGLVVMAILGSGLINLIVAIAIAVTPRFSRLSHGPVVSIREKDYVKAAEAIGASNFRIMFVEILPNIIGELIVMGTIWTATTIRLEANLSFIGLGVEPRIPTWGSMVKNGINYLGSNPWISIFPGLAILLTVLSFNMLGDGLRDISDPRSQS